MKPSARTSDHEAAVLAVHPGALGDVILFGHLLAGLDAPVTLVGGGEKARLLAGAGVVAGAMDFDALPIDELFAEPQPPRPILPERLGRYGRLISCFGGGDRRVELRLAAGCGASEAAFLPIRPPDGSTAHLLEHWRDMLGLRKSPVPARWSVPDDWRRAAGLLLSEAGLDDTRPYHLLHAGAGAEAKRWSIDGFVAVAGKLEQPVFVLGPVELERWPDREVELLKSAGAVLASPELTTLACLLAGAAGYVGNDSGVSHLSAAVGAPTVAVFTATEPEQFAPQGPAVGTLDARGGEVKPGEVLSVLASLTG